MAQNERWDRRESPRRLQRDGGLTLPDQCGAVLRFRERIYDRDGDPERNAHIEAEHRRRSFRPMDWHPVDLRRSGLPADTGTRYGQGFLRYGQRLRLEPRLCRLPYCDRTTGLIAGCDDGPRVLG